MAEAANDPFAGTSSVASDGHAAVEEGPVALILFLFRILIAFVTVAYIGLIGILCAHWLRAGKPSVLYLALLPALMLLLLNVVLWRAGRKS